MPDHDYLDRVLIGGRKPVDRVPLVRYDPAWPERYERERRRLATVLGPVAVAIEHIGSTAVPGLIAKAIIDICVLVPDVEEELAYDAPLMAAGYALRVKEAGHRMYRTGALDVQIHIYSFGSPEIEAYLLFRDRLRADPQDRDLYARTKEELSGRAWDDMNYYAQAKGPVIQEILARARASATPL